MTIFLVLSSSAVAFYIFVLCALWYDNRKHRNRRVSSWHSANFDDVWGFEADSAHVVSLSSRAKIYDGVHWLPVAKLDLRTAKRNVAQ